MAIMLNPRDYDPDVEAKPLWQKLAWFMGLVVVSGTVVMVTAYALRGVLFL